MPRVREFLSERLHLELHDGKLTVSPVWHGVEFLGAWVKPHRIFASRSSVGRIGRKLDALASSSVDEWESPLNSYCGLLGHWQNYSIRRRLLAGREEFGQWGMFDTEVRHWYGLG